MAPTPGTVTYYPSYPEKPWDYPIIARRPYRTSRIRTAPPNDPWEQRDRVIEDHRRRLGVVAARRAR